MCRNFDQEFFMHFSYLIWPVNDFQWCNSLNDVRFNWLIFENYNRFDNSWLISLAKHFYSAQLEACTYFKMKKLKCLTVAYMMKNAVFVLNKESPYIVCVLILKLYVFCLQYSRSVYSCTYRLIYHSITDLIFHFI